VVQNDLGEGLAIEGEGDAAIREERAHPFAQFRGEAEECENMNKAVDVEVVEESLDVKEEEACNLPTLDAHLDRMGHAQDSIGGSMVVAGPKLVRGEEVEPRGVQQDAFRHDTLKELATALQEGYRPVRLRDPVIYFTRLRDGDNGSAAPWVVAPCDSSIKQGGETRWVGRMTPFEEFVSDARGARGRLVGRACEVTQDLFIQNGCKATRWERGRIVGVRYRDRMRDDGEESV